MSLGSMNLEALEKHVKTLLAEGKFELAYEELKKIQACYESCMSAWASQGHRALSRHYKAMRNEKKDKKNEVLTEKNKQIVEDVLKDLPPDFIKEPLMVQARKLNISFENIPSFRRSMIMRTKGRVSSRLSREWVLNDKKKAYKFAKLIGLSVPQVYASGVSRWDIDYERLSKTVVKPASGAGSRGVFLFYSKNKIFDVSTGEWMHSHLEMAKKMEREITAGTINSDSWILEEMVLESEEENTPARDLKFYCFYGKVGLVLEISRLGGKKYCEWNGEGNPINSGKYTNLFKGDGVTEEQLNFVRQASLKIPAPFMRIDFLRSGNAPGKLVFGEFTPRPGNFHAFSVDTDRLLGSHYLMAEARLENDLVRNKNAFADYRKFLGIIK
ncbi:hypothetical protein HBJ58_19920 [Halomonas desiderata]|nr:hypothetical protein [Halomonas desiderata]